MKTTAGDSAAVQKKGPANASPENLDSYIRVTSPPVWAALIGILALVLGAFIWAMMGQLKVEVNSVALVKSSAGDSLRFVSGQFLVLAPREIRCRFSVDFLDDVLLIVAHLRVSSSFLLFWNESPCRTSHGEPVMYKFTLAFLFPQVNRGSGLSNPHNPLAKRLYAFAASSASTICQHWGSRAKKSPDCPLATAWHPLHHWESRHLLQSSYLSSAR